MPQAQMSTQSWRGAAVRMVVAASALTLLLALLPGAPQRSIGADLQDRISTTRSGQLWAERSMRKADKTIVSLYQEQRAEKRALKKSKKKLTKTKKRRGKARNRADASRNAYDKAYRIRQREAANDAKSTVSKRKIVKLRATMRKDQNAWLSLDRMVGRIKVAKKARKRRIGGINRKIGRVKGRRESAEATLRGTIANMTSLARDRVAVQVDVQLTRDGSTFSWPADGRISQQYGCTGFSFNPRRGSCKHFHDGIDIANVAGTPIRSMAAGVVAYVGWNPSDIRGRAFIVVVAHPGGLITRYGHMLPIRRVRAGQVVKKGELIARMGSTGNSTGSHLHVELLQGWTPLDPNVFLPPRDFTPTKQPKKQSSKKSSKKSAKQSNKKQSNKKPSKRSNKKPARPPLDAATLEACDDRPALPGAAVVGPAGVIFGVDFAGFLQGVTAADCEPLEAEVAADAGESMSAEKTPTDSRTASSGKKARKTSRSSADPVRAGPSIRARSSSPKPQ